MALKTIDALDLAGKRVFIRVDFNVPLDAQGKVTDDARIRAALPTIQHAIRAKAKVILASHLGRPKGKPEDREKYSLEPAAERLSELLRQDVILADDCIGDGVKKLVRDLKDGQVLLLENLRFHPEEEKNDENFAKELAILMLKAKGATEEEIASLKLAVERVARFHEKQKSQTWLSTEEPDVLLEDKGLSLSVHYRRASRPAEATAPPARAARAPRTTSSRREILSTGAECSRCSSG